MGKSRYIKDEIWRDSWFYNLNKEQKLVWLYLLTNPNANVAGLYKMNRAIACAELCMARRTLDSALEHFVQSNKILVKDEWVFLVNFLKHQSDSEKIIAGVRRILSETPKDVLEYLYGIDTIPIGYQTLLNLTLLNLTPHNEESEGVEDVKKN